MSTVGIIYKHKEGVSTVGIIYKHKEGVSINYKSIIKCKLGTVKEETGEDIQSYYKTFIHLILN